MAEMVVECDNCGNANIKSITGDESFRTLTAYCHKCKDSFEELPEEYIVKLNAPKKL